MLFNNTLLKTEDDQVQAKVNHKKIINKVKTAMKISSKEAIKQELYFKLEKLEANKVISEML